MPGLVGALVVIGLTVVVPLGLHLAGGAPGRRAWPLLGLLAGAGLLLPRGTSAVLLVAPVAVAAALATAHGARRAVREERDPGQQLVSLTAAGALSVAAASLMAERAGYRALGFDLDVLGLTVAHFVFAGFAAALLAGLTARVVPGRAAATGVLALPAGTALVAAGYFAGEALELLGALVVTTGLLSTSWALLRRVVPATPDSRARALLRAAACATPLTMTLALWWAAGEAMGLPHPSLTQTAATHGVLNALVVGLGGLLGFALRERAAGATPAPPPLARLRG